MKFVLTEAGWFVNPNQVTRVALSAISLFDTNPDGDHAVIVTTSDGGANRAGKYPNRKEAQQAMVGLVGLLEREGEDA